MIKKLSEQVCSVTFAPEVIEHKKVLYVGAGCPVRNGTGKRNLRIAGHEPHARRMCKRPHNLSLIELQTPIGRHNEITDALQVHFVRKVGYLCLIFLPVHDAILHAG